MKVIIITVLVFAVAAAESSQREAAQETIPPSWNDPDGCDDSSCIRKREASPVADAQICGDLPCTGFPASSSKRRDSPDVDPDSSTLDYLLQREALLLADDDPDPDCDTLDCRLQREASPVADADPDCSTLDCRLQREALPVADADWDCTTHQCRP